MEARAELQAECPWCGEVSLEPTDLHCRIEPAGERGLCEFRCPICTRLVLLPATAKNAGALLEAGATSISGLVPFEVTEPHLGPPLSWDDLLDLHLALARTDRPQEELAA